MFLYIEKKLMIIAKIDPRTFPKTNNFVFLQNNNDDAEKLLVKYMLSLKVLVIDIFILLTMFVLLVNYPCDLIIYAKYI